ncbi:MAG: hypothetical protein Q9187_003627 [Circinaria calcarea]
MTGFMTSNGKDKLKWGLKVKGSRALLTANYTTSKPVSGRKRKQAETDDSEFRLASVDLGSSNRGGMQASVQDKFPLYCNGSVLIQLSSDPGSVYQLHKPTLKRCSSWFAEKMKAPVVMLDPATDNTVKYRFHLEQDLLEAVPLLRCGALPNARNSCCEILQVAEIAKDSLASSSGSSQGGSSGTVMSELNIPSAVPEPDISVSVKREPGINELPASTSEPDMAPPDSSQGTSSEAKSSQHLGVPEVRETQQSSTGSFSTADSDRPLKIATEEYPSQEKKHRGYVLAHDNLLRMFYGEVPLISSNDIDQALEQCERLVTIARHYGSLHIIRPHLGNSLSQFRHDLYKAIAKDPPRWSILAVALESAFIYSEALVHCVGCWPHWPWTTPSTALQAETLSAVLTKGKELLALRSEINQELLINSLGDHDGRPVTLKKSAEQWMIVSIWRDWLARSLQFCRNSGDGHFGTYYRTLSKGGDAYLPAEKQAAKLCGISGPGMEVWDEVAIDLNILKEFAIKAVAPLVKNNLTLDPVSVGIEYLTCTEVTADDYPWLKATKNPL